MRNALVSFAFVAIAVAGSLVFAAKTPVEVTGTEWTGAAAIKASVKGLGGDSDTSLVFVSFPTEGNWLSEDDEGYDYSGTWTRSGSGFLWHYDAGGESEFERMMENWIEEALADAGEPQDIDVTLHGAEGKAKVKAKNGILISMKWKLKATFTAYGDEGQGAGKYQEKGIALPAK